MGCLENLNYEILAKNCSFKETRDIVKQMCKERYEIPPGFKIVEKAVIGIPPIHVGIRDEKLVCTYTKPCHGTFVILVDSPEDIANVRKNGKAVK